MADFGTVYLPQNNALSSFYAAQGAALTNAGKATSNQLAADTLGSDTQIKANVAQSGSLANQFSTQMDPLRILQLKQLLGEVPTPGVDQLTSLPGGTPGSATPASDGGSAKVPADYLPFYQEASQRTGIPVDVLIAQGAQESRFNPNAVGGAGEIGLHQILPSTARDPGFGMTGVDPATLRDPRTNINFAADYLKARAGPRTDFSNPATVDAALKNYNSGGDPNYVANVRRHMAGGAGVPVAGARVGAVAPTAQAVPGAAPTPVQVAGPGAPTNTTPPAADTPNHDHAINVSGALSQQILNAPPEQRPALWAQYRPIMVQAGAVQAPVDYPGDAVLGYMAKSAQDPEQRAQHIAGLNGTPPAAGPPGTAPTPPDQAAWPVAAPSAAPSPTAPPIANPNALLGVASPGAIPAAPTNQLMPAASAALPQVVPQPSTAPSASPTTGQPQVQQLQALQQKIMQAELIAARNPNNPIVQKTAAAVVENLKAQASMLNEPTEDVVKDGLAHHIGKITHQEVGAPTPVGNDARMVFQQVPGGSQAFQSGHPVGPVIPFSGRPEQSDAYKADLPTAQTIVANGQTAQTNMLRLNEMANISQQLATGPTAEIRAKAAAYLEAAGASPETIKSWTGMASGGTAQEFVKLSLATAGAAARTDIGSNNGIQSTQLYLSANPNLALLPDANKRMTNMIRVASQFSQDYTQAALQHFGTNESAFLKGGNYTPLTTFNREWLGQANPQVGAAAMGILNGDPFAKWSAKLSKPSDYFRAAQIAARVDPKTMVPGRDGVAMPVDSILSHPGASSALTVTPARP